MLSKIRTMARRMNVPEGRLQKIVAVAIVSSLVPENTVIKGGNSLSLRFPLTQTRFSKDLDLVLSEGFERWKAEFSENLKKGTDSFTGRLVDRGQPAAHPHVRNKIDVFSYDVKLDYLGKAFATLPLDITSPIVYEKDQPPQEWSEDTRSLMSYLGIELGGRVRLLTVEAQLAQKSAALFSDDPRPSDIVDMELLFSEMDRSGDEQTYTRLLKYELDARGIPSPYGIGNLNILRKQYLSMFKDETVLDSVLARLHRTAELIQKDPVKTKTDALRMLEKKKENIMNLKESKTQPQSHEKGGRER
ncbi:MAG: nucleotidyl transferase AbiEii/AbiGii toxin family protein [Bifidobacteriaceae bacterium]|nr:nucleotidyl transferase AbiEii/AbiGii toxin family protein [Bifidobacteriaceae bacterium]